MRLLWLVLWMSSAPSWADAPVDEAVKPVAAAAVPGLIDGQKATFRIPVSPQAKWAWNLGTPGSREYAWLVEVLTPNGRRRFGVQVWHERGAVPAQGTLLELLATGEVGVWPTGDDEGEPMEGLEVSAMVQENAVVISVSHAETFQALFSSRPGQYTVVTTRGHSPRPDQRFSREQTQAFRLIYRD